jgi:hypothetical protein
MRECRAGKALTNLVWSTVDMRGRQKQGRIDGRQKSEHDHTGLGAKPWEIFCKLQRLASTAEASSLLLPYSMMAYMLPSIQVSDSSVQKLYHLSIYKNIRTIKNAMYYHSFKAWHATACRAAWEPK